jgi:dTDP-4-amino-4,6-dideoxygalactose transaminase
MSFVAPAGTPVSLADVLAGVLNAGGEGAPARLRSMLCTLSGTSSGWLFSSGRAAMVVAFSAMRRLAGNGRDRVVMPAYTCYSVPAAAARAGLRPVFCDIDPTTLSMDMRRLEQLDYSRVLAIVTANLYGLPNALADIEALARRKGVFMLDDAAQALGAGLGGRAVGGFGDVGLYSFDKGKNITTIQGGALVSRNAEFAREMEAALSGVAPPVGAATCAALLKLLLYSLLLRPAAYGVVRKLPGLGLGRTVYDVDYPITCFSSSLAAIAVRLGERLEALTRARGDSARRLRTELRGLAGVKLVDELAGAEPGYVRFPLLAESTGRRDAILAALDSAGIGATGSYPKALPDVPEVGFDLDDDQETFQGARTVASTIVTLPTHAYCPPDLAARIHAAIAACAP